MQTTLSVEEPSTRVQRWQGTPSHRVLDNWWRVRPVVMLPPNLMSPCRDAGNALEAAARYSGIHYNLCVTLTKRIIANLSACAERSLRYSNSVRLSVRLSVCPSVTRRHCVKTKEHRMMPSSLSDRPLTLVLAIWGSSIYSQGIIPNDDVKWDRNTTQRRLFHKSLALKPCEWRPNLLLTINKKWHMPFRLVTNYMT